MMEPNVQTARKSVSMTRMAPADPYRGTMKHQTKKTIWGASNDDHGDAGA